jgi:hypothetical protein
MLPRQRVLQASKSDDLVGVTAHPPHHCSFSVSVFAVLRRPIFIWLANHTRVVWVCE